MGHPSGRSSRPASNGTGSGLDEHRRAAENVTEAVAVPILSLRPADSPRLNGEDKAHIARLAETESPLPPILVHRRTMRVIDGMHRLMAASLQGRETINVVFFDGSEEDSFLRAVEENVIHGMPLSRADRRHAAERIIASHPQMSDRAIGQASGLTSKTVATIRKRSTGDVPRSDARVGRDGRVRPLDSGEGRRRAAQLLADNPDASAREVARAVGISPTTVLDVRKRLERGKQLIPQEASSIRNGMAAEGAVDSRSMRQPGLTATVQKLLHDPSLRSNDQGKGMLRLLHINAVGAEHLPEVVPAVPPHCVSIVAGLAREYAKIWQDFAEELDGRARIIE